MNPDEILSIMEDSEGREIRVIDQEFMVTEGKVDLYEPPQDSEEASITLIDSDGCRCFFYQNDINEIEFMD